MCAGENSYSHHSDSQVGVSVIDRFTYYTQQFFSDINLDSNVTMSRWRDELTFERLRSTVVTEYGSPSSWCNDEVRGGFSRCMP